MCARSDSGPYNLRTAGRQAGRHTSASNPQRGSDLVFAFGSRGNARVPGTTSPEPPSAFDAVSPALGDPITRRQAGLEPCVFLSIQTLSIYVTRLEDRLFDGNVPSTHPAADIIVRTDRPADDDDDDDDESNRDPRAASLSLSSGAPVRRVKLRKARVPPSRAEIPVRQRERERERERPCRLSKRQSGSGWGERYEYRNCPSPRAGTRCPNGAPFRPV